jgi:MFS family permease
MTSHRWKLCLMMFLEFFIWGAWFPLIFGYLPSLGFNALEQTVILVAFNVAAITAMFFSTQFADRHFAAEKFLAFSQLVGGVAMLALFWVKAGWTTEVAGWEINVSFLAFFLLLLVHSLFYVPTISITNSIAFAHLRDPQREFGWVRLWGTIGWIAAAWPMTFILINWERIPEFDSLPLFDWFGEVLGTSKEGAAFRLASSYSFVVAGSASLVLAAFSLSLPHTPAKPATRAGEKLAWLEAMKLLAKPFVLVLFIATFFDAAVHQYYFAWVERYLTTKQDLGGVGISPNWAMPVISISQVAEIGTMAFLGLVLKGLGWRYTMVVGILGHAARFTVFAYFPEPWIAVSINVLHGICYAFFFATVYIFVDEFFPKDARSSAQGLFNLLILGLGPIAANFAAPWLGEVFKGADGVIDFRSLFLIPAGVALGAALFLLLFFHPPARAQKEPMHHLPETKQPAGRWSSDR